MLDGIRMKHRNKLKNMRHDYSEICFKNSNEIYEKANMISNLDMKKRRLTPINHEELEKEL